MKDACYCYQYNAWSHHHFTHLQHCIRQICFIYTISMVQCNKCTHIEELKTRSEYNATVNQRRGKICFFSWEIATNIVQ